MRGTIDSTMIPSRRFHCGFLTCTVCARHLPKHRQAHSPAWASLLPKCLALQENVNWADHRAQQHFDDSLFCLPFFFETVCFCFKLQQPKFVFIAIFFSLNFNSARLRSDRTSSMNSRVSPDSILPVLFDWRSQNSLSTHFKFDFSVLCSIEIFDALQESSARSCQC